MRNDWSAAMHVVHQVGETSRCWNSPRLPDPESIDSPESTRQPIGASSECAASTALRGSQGMDIVDLGPAANRSSVLRANLIQNPLALPIDHRQNPGAARCRGSAGPAATPARW